MPNYCDFSMKIKGKKENVKTLIDWLSAHYNYSDKDKIQVYNLPDGVDMWSGEIDESIKIPCDHHIGYRVFEVYPHNSGEEIEDDEPYMIDGYCAWSVYSCMFKGDGLGTYMGDDTYVKDENKSISIDDASKELGLQIEIFSEEPGMCFAEHYYINNGKIICEEETEFSETWLEYYNKESETFDENAYNELTEDFKIKVEEAIANGEELMRDGGYFNEDIGDYDWQYL